MRNSRLDKKSQTPKMFFFVGICFLMAVCPALLAQWEISDENKYLENIRRVLIAKSPGRKVSRETMQKIYEQVKTPYKYGIILKSRVRRARKSIAQVCFATAMCGT